MNTHEQKVGQSSLTPKKGTTILPGDDVCVIRERSAQRFKTYDPEIQLLATGHRGSADNIQLPHVVG